MNYILHAIQIFLLIGLFVFVYFMNDENYKAIYKENNRIQNLIEEYGHHYRGDDKD